jgi:peptidoglycan-associated lipoprotein
VVSYGEERPVCNESGEGCWSQNRRVEIVYTAK